MVCFGSPLPLRDLHGTARLALHCGRRKKGDENLTTKSWIYHGKNLRLKEIHDALARYERSNDIYQLVYAKNHLEKLIEERKETKP